ncbi:flagellar basal body rod protein FlgB [Candidatus Dependentiae bacterium]|nr:flagellar basal body rod protein FlgB [Candidatus Dependentiae bacterium]
MFKNTSYNQTFNILHRGLDCTTLRHQTIANNISNVNTPHYKRKEVTFEGELHRALYGPQPIPAAVTHENHLRFKGQVELSEVVPKVNVENETFIRNDENNVDMNQEMAELAKNNLSYDSYITSMTVMVQQLKSVLQKGGRV